MLTIRKEQMDALSSVMRERYVAKTVLHLRKLFPEETKKMPDTELRPLIEEGLNRARGYQVTSGREVTLFIDLMVGIGKNFETQPANAWIKGFLEDPELDQSEKMNLICKRLQAMNR